MQLPSQQLYASKWLKKQAQSACSRMRLSQLRTERPEIGTATTSKTLAPGDDSRRHAPFGVRDFKLRRLAGVSAAGACCRSPERREGSLKVVPGDGLEPSRPFRGPGF